MPIRKSAHFGGDSVFRNGAPGTRRPMLTLRAEKSGQIRLTADQFVPPIVTTINQP